MSELHRLLSLQLENAKLDSKEAPSRRDWVAFLRRVNRAYHAADARRAKLKEAFSKTFKENKSLREQLLAAREQVQQLEHSRELFLAQLGHEIRTPLNGITGMASLLDSSRLSGEQRKQLGSIQQSCEDLLRVMEDLLELTQAGRGEVHLHEEQFSLDEEVERVCQGLADAAARRKVEVHSLVDPALPAYLQGDRQRFAQVLNTLISNAIDRSRNGQVSIQVKLQEGEPVTVRCEVQDAGPALTLEHPERLFEIHTSPLESGSPPAGGSVLGLPLAKHLVELLGGEIGFKTLEESGNLFWFTAQLKTGSKPAQTAIAALPQLKGRVLLVEDNHFNQQVVEGMLSKLGLQFNTANDGVEALEQLESQPFDLILMDCQMPRMDGYQCTAEIRQRDWSSARVSIVAITAHAQPDQRERCLQVGMDDYLSKPLTLDRLAVCLQQWLPEAPDERFQMELENLPDEILDLAHFGTIRDLREQNLSNGQSDLFELFFDEVFRLLGEFSTAFESKDRDSQHQALHSLKGCAGNFGAKQLLALAQLGLDQVRAERELPADFAERLPQAVELVRTTVQEGEQLLA